MEKTKRTQIAKTLRAAAQKLSQPQKLTSTTGEMESFLQSYNFAKKAALDSKEAALIAQHLDRVVAEFNKKYPVAEFQTDAMFKNKSTLDTAQKTAKMAIKASNPKEAKKLAHRAYGMVADVSLSLDKAVAASTVSAKFAVLLMGEKAGTAETLAEVPGPDAKRAVQQALKLVVDPSFDLSLPENKPKVKVEQRSTPEGNVDVAWVSFDPYTTLLLLPSQYAKNWKQIGIRQGGQPLAAQTKVQASKGKKVVKPGKLGSAGIWEDEVVAETMSLTDILEGLDEDHLAKNMSDTMGMFDTDYTPSPKDITDWNRSKVSDEAITVFGDAATNAYRSAWENAAEGYYVQKVIENVIDLLNGASGEAQYDAEGSDGEEVSVQVPFDVTAKETGDIDGIFSNPYIEVSISNPGHLVNYVESVLGYQGGEPVDQPVAAVGTSALGSLLSMLKSESRSEVKNLGDVNTDHADMDWDLFKENFENNVLEMDPGEIAECIETYANDSEESVEDVVDMVMKAIPGLDKMSGAIASALEGGYDARQQKLPLQGALKALAAAEAAIKAAKNPIANIREKRAAAAKRGDTKAVSYWSEKLRNALSKGPAPSSTTKSKIASKAVKAAKKWSMCPVCEASFQVAPGEPLPPHSFLRQPCSGSGQAGE